MHTLAVPPPPPLPERLHEHVGGVSLEQLAARNRLDDAAAWYIGYRIFLALGAAHAAREPTTRGLAPVIPRDVSPANVLVPWDGYVTLSDLRIVGAGGPAVVAGYLTPEQARGDALDVRTDVYAGCLVLRELLLGAPVFAGAGQSEMQRRAAMADPRLVPLAALRPGLPLALTAAVDVGLSPEPDRRSITAEEMAALLGDAIDLEAARAKLVAAVARVRRGEEPLAYAARPDTGASLFDESSRELGLATDTVTAHRSPLERPGSASRTSSPLLLETPNVMMTARRPRPAPVAAPAARRHRAPMALVAAAAAAIAVGIAIGGALGLRERTSARSPTALRARPPSPSAHAALAPLPLAAGPAGAALPPAAPGGRTGRLLTAPSEAGHRVFVDGRLAGSGGAPLVVRCGTHEVRVGSAGRLWRVEVPCDGAVEVTR